jgi:hypothetical protein
MKLVEMKLAATVPASDVPKRFNIIAMWDAMPSVRAPPRSLH